MSVLNSLMTSNQGGGSRLKSAVCSYSWTYSGKVNKEYFIHLDLPSDCGEILYYRIETYQETNIGRVFISRVFNTNDAFTLTGSYGDILSSCDVINVILLYYPKE